MVSSTDQLITTHRLSRRDFISALAALAVAGCRIESVIGAPNPSIPERAANQPPIPVNAINHMTLAVSDPVASVAWYQQLFGLPIAARQGNTVVLQIGDGPQFMAIGGNSSDNPRITHYCLAVDNFDHDRLVQILSEHGVAAAGEPGALQSWVRMRGSEFGGAPGGSPELYFGDPDGIVVQLQDNTYCGGAGFLGNECLAMPEPAPGPGLISLLEYNHFTQFVSDAARSQQFYQDLFGLPIDTYQGAMPIFRVGSGREFLAMPQVPALAGRIHHASLNVDDFDVDRIFGLLDAFGLTVLGEAQGATGPLQTYITMRGADRGGAVEGTPELYFTDPDGILLQLQDSRYCGGAGYFGEQCGTVENPTGRDA